MMKNNLKRIGRVVSKMIKIFNLFDINLQENKKEIANEIEDGCG